MLNASAATNSPYTILVVDNEPDICTLFALVLRQVGFTVLTASSGVDALSSLDAVPVDLVLTDYQMPEMDGDQLIAIVRTQYPRIRTILMSAYPYVGHLAAQCHADGYFLKASPLQQFLDEVHAILAGAR